MDVFFLSIFAVFTAATWWAFRVRVRMPEALEKKISLCRVVALWSLWLALIAGASALNAMEDEHFYGVSILGWAVVGAVNLGITGYVVLVWSALRCWRAEKERKKDGRTGNDP